MRYKRKFNKRELDTLVPVAVPMSDSFFREWDEMTKVNGEDHEGPIELYMDNYLKRLRKSDDLPENTTVMYVHVREHLVPTLNREARRRATNPEKIILQQMRVMLNLHKKKRK